MSDDQQSPEVLRLGEHLYPMLSIIEEPDPQHPQMGMPEPVNFEYFVFLTSFEETFNARWQIGKRSYGRLNPMHYYGGTEREANISFTLPAMTAHESAQNLRKCSELSRAVYGKYRNWDVDPWMGDFTMVGHRYFRANFGNLITDERVFISSFSFKINLDAGIFDYTERDWGSAAAALESLTSGANPVNSQIWEEVLPRQIDVEIGMIFRHDYSLGFGGPNRVGHPDRWAANNGKDFPHGSGVDVQEYMSRSLTPSEMVEIGQAMDDLQQRLYDAASEYTYRAQELRAARDAGVTLAPSEVLFLRTIDEDEGAWVDEGAED